MRLLATLLVLLAPASFVVAQDKKPVEKEKPADMKGYEVGATVADFTLNDAEGKKTSLKAIAEGKKFLVLSFWSRKCPAAVNGEPYFSKIQADYEAKGVTVVYLASNKQENKVEGDVAATKEYVKKTKITWPVLLDVDNKIANVFGGLTTPHVYVIDAKTMKVVYTGGLVGPDGSIWKPENVKKEYVREALDLLLAGKPLATSATKAEGCTIKRVVE
jgi:peroxiredoxin